MNKGWHRWTWLNEYLYHYQFLQHNLKFNREQNKILGGFSVLWCAQETLSKFDHLKISSAHSTLCSLHLHSKLSGWTQVNSRSLGRGILINIRWHTFIALNLLCLLFQKYAACTYTANWRREGEREREKGGKKERKIRRERRKKKGSVNWQK